MSALQLTLSQRKFFDQHGYLRLEQAVSQTQLRLARKRIHDELSRSGIDSAGRGLPKTLRSLPVFQQIGRLSQLVNFPDLKVAVIPQDVEKLVHALGNAKVMSTQSQLLLSPPRQGDWHLAGLNWHVDVSTHQVRIPGIQVFVLIDDLEEHGGATLVLSGSHLHADDTRMKSRIRDAVQSGKMEEALLRELGLAVVELTGKSGDAYLMDMRTLHTPSVNASNQMRVVATVRYFLE
jgi:Phytanoyl-CoA dioxygenase (PhyH)